MGFDASALQAGSFRADRTFRAIKAELVNDEQTEFGVEADAVVDRLVRQRRGEVFEEFTTGDVTDPLFEHARGQADTLNQSAFNSAITVLL